ncbi:MFS transporter [Arthrobacter sp. NPDC093128]|uniref:MFS transporter n=1 Tax=Arthrobacter sp. NPDC093128 TaxID=3154979 RepID=UPI003417C97C
MDQHDNPGAGGTATSQVVNEGSSPSRGNGRAAFASFSGTLIEIYDFIIYGTAAALVFPLTFFPALGPAQGMVVSFATFGAAFVARPFGSIIFGHYGDRLGRKKTLVTTLLLMGVATVLVGALPTAGQIGIFAPIILVVLRLVQGLAAGGEWAGATLFVTEHAPKGKRGFWAMFPLLGGTLALSLGNAAFLLTGFGMSDEAFLHWGWRIPFLASIVLIVVGLWVRLKVDETPVFKSEQKRSGVVKLPFAECLKRQPREILLASGVGLTTFCYTFISGTYITAYAVSTLKLARTEVLLVGVVSGIVLSLGVVIGAVLADRIGRRPVLLIAHVAAALWNLALFQLLDGASVAIFAVVLWTTMLISGINYGPMGSFIPELFQTRYRYTAAGISYNLGTLVGGAIVPILATAVAAAYGTQSVGLLLCGLSVTAIACTLALRETKNSELDWVDVKA